MFVKGQSGNPAGRPKGSPNKVTRSVKAAFEDAFNTLQEGAGPASLTEWAKANPTEFYRLAKALIPQKLEHEGGVVLNVVTGVPSPDEDVSDIA